MQTQAGNRGAGPSRLRRVWAYGFSIAVLAAVLWPVLGDPRSDSFPLSTYPMFSGKKAANAEIAHIVGFTEAGEREVLPPSAIANDEVIQAFETIRQAIGRGDTATAALCDEAAAWALDRRERLVSVSIVTDTYDAVAYFEGDKAPLGTQVHAECAVQR